MFKIKNLKHIFRIFIIFLSLFFINLKNITAQNSSAYNNIRVTVNSYCADTDLSSSNGKTRESGCYASNYDTNSETCERSTFKFDPFGNNIDLNWNYGNDYCLGYLLGAGITMEAAFIGCRLLCPTPSDSIGKKAFEKLTQGTGVRKKIGQASHVAKQASGTTNLVAQGIMGGMPLDPFTVIELGIFSARCANLVESANCCTALATCGIASSVAVGIVGGIFESAKYVFENVQICGRGWKVWEKDASSNQWKMTDGKYKKCLNKIFSSAISSSITHDCSSINSPSQQRFCYFLNNYKKDALCNLSDGDTNKSNSVTNLYFREHLFKGIEYEDNGNGACKNPVDSSDKWSNALGYSGGNQRYYFRGSNQMPNFACKRFLQFGKKDVEGLKAYICCNERSQNTLCLENFSENKYVFCNLGGDCSKKFDRANVVNTKYKIFESERNPNYICAKTYSSCPYDHNVQGGTDYDERFALNPKIITNFCQYMNHCIIKPPISKYTSFDAETFFLAGACEDLKGNSQFVSKDEAWLANNFISINPRHFSAPIVQCFKESLENNFLQITGRTVCVDPDEEPKKSSTYPDGFCQSGYLAKKGDKLNQTFFNKIQNQFRFPIKLALVLSVTFLGFNILLATPESYINKKTIMTYLVKFGLVYFFVLGSAWQSFFMDSVMNISTQLSNITFQPDNKKNDGCIFPKYNFETFERIKSGENYSSITKNDYITSLTTNPSYPIGKSYLRIWDTLDCKIARALGYGPDVSTPNLAKMIFSGLLTGGLGVTFFFAAFAYGFILISIVMRAIHITIMSIIAVILLIYVSPLTITCALFERTKGIFENWWKQMLGFILQPMILFAYLGLLFTVFDNAFIGDAYFEDVGTMGNNKLIPDLKCDKKDNDIIDPKETSVYCILNLAEYKSYSGMEVFDLALPILSNLNQTKINTLLKSAILMFVFLNFFDKITYVARKLVGGAELKSDAGLAEIQKQIKKVAQGVTKRATNASMNVARKSVPAIKEKIRGGDDSSSKNIAKPKEDSSSQASDSAGGNNTPPPAQDSVSPAPPPADN